MKNFGDVTWAGALSVLLLCTGAGQAEENARDTDRQNLSASREIEGFISPFQSEGGMITEIVAEAFNAARPGENPTWNSASDSLKSGLAFTTEAGAIAFPIPKPRCNRPSLLSEHTAKLCSGFFWSEPLFHVIVSGYVAAGRDWFPARNSELLGSTICQPYGESALSLRDRGLSALNSRLVVAASPEECLRLVAAGESDIAFLPMMVAEPELKRIGLLDKIQHAEALDVVMSVHAIAAHAKPMGVENIAVLNRGLARIRADGRWFEIVKANGDGHRERRVAHVVE